MASGSPAAPGRSVGRGPRAARRSWPACSCCSRRWPTGSTGSSCCSPTATPDIFYGRHLHRSQRRHAGEADPALHLDHLRRRVLRRRLPAQPAAARDRDRAARSCRACSSGRRGRRCCSSSWSRRTRSIREADADPAQHRRHASAAFGIGSGQGGDQGRRTPASPPRRQQQVAQRQGDDARTSGCWIPAKISETFTQLEQGRAFYGFQSKLDIDRYAAERRHQVQDYVVAARELNAAGLTGNQQSTGSTSTSSTRTATGSSSRPADKINEARWTRTPPAVRAACRTVHQRSTRAPSRTRRTCPNSLKIAAAAHLLRRAAELGDQSGLLDRGRAEAVVTPREYDGGDNAELHLHRHRRCA